MVILAVDRDGFVACRGLAGCQVEKLDVLNPTSLRDQKMRALTPRASCNYDAYAQAKERKEALQEAALENQRRKVEQIEKFIERFRYKATKARQVQSRIKSLEKLERIEVGETRRTIRFAFPQPKRSGKLVAALKGVYKAYGPVTVYSGIDLEILRGDKVAFVGPNGAGKSTLLKLLAGVLRPDEGTIELGYNVTSAYFAQHQLELLDTGKTVWEEIFSLAKDEPVSFLRSLLGAFLFSGEETEKTSQIAFVHLDPAGEQIAPRPHHGAAQLMQPRPGRLSPWIRTGAGVAAACSMSRWTSRMGALRPSMARPRL